MSGIAINELLEGIRNILFFISFKGLGLGSLTENIVGIIYC